MTDAKAHNRIMPYEQRHRTQPFVVVGCIIERNGKFMLVQEAQHSARGLWNQPEGWLDMREKIQEAAFREAYEETGLELELVGFLGVYSLIRPRQGEVNHAIKFIFGARAINDKPKFDPDEILDARWFTLEEIEQLGTQLRDPDIIQEIKDFQANRFFPAEGVSRYTDALPPELR